jgi:hypothetical protein
VILSVLRIWDVYPISWTRIFSIPDPGSEIFPSRIRIKEFMYCSSLSRIWILIFYPPRIAGSKRHRIPDPDKQHWKLFDLASSKGAERRISSNIALNSSCERPMQRFCAIFCICIGRQIRLLAKTDLRYFVVCTAPYCLTCNFLIPRPPKATGEAFSHQRRTSST